MKLLPDFLSKLFARPVRRRNAGFPAAQINRLTNSWTTDPSSINKWLRHDLRTLRARLPGVPLIVDAGIGSPADAVQAMELGLDAVLLNSAVAHAVDPVRMARAFKLGIASGRLAYEAGVMPRQDMAVASTPVAGHPILL